MINLIKKLPQKPINSRAPSILFRGALIVFVVYLFFSAFLAENFIFTHLQHEHDSDGAGDSCLMCYEIQLAQLFLEGLARIGAIALSASIFIYAKHRLKKPALIYRSALSPILLKVKLNF